VEHVAAALQWLRAVLPITPELLRAVGAQLLVIIIGLLLAIGLRRLSVTRMDALVERVDSRLRNPRIMLALRSLVTPSLWWVLVVLGYGLFGEFGYRNALLDIAASLILAWVVINAISALVRDVFLSRAIATVIWLIVALEILGLLHGTEAALDSFSITLGSLRLSLLAAIEAGVLLTVLLWAAIVVSRLVQIRISKVTAFSPSIRVLIANVSKITLMALAVIVALNTIGIDLTALAVFSGAIGVGIGFGLQKVVSNLISGIILLLDESIKPGDVIEIDETFGWITSLNARYVSISSRDGKEFLVPNEDLVTHRVVNWSYSSPLVRLDVPFGVAYASDLRRVRELACAAAGQSPRVLEQPAPVCHVTGFGDSSVGLLLRVWINDPINGITNVKGDVFLALYESLYANGIELPFPQREIRIKTAVGDREMP
jgi:small-conductance mechanosensitive channel